MPRSPGLTLEESRALNKLLVLGGTTTIPVQISETEFCKLVGVIYRDLGKETALDQGLRTNIVPKLDYFSIPLEWFGEKFSLPSGGHIDIFLKARAEIADFFTYLRCLSELHKRRKKYSRILSAQPLPTMLQVSPRALLEYGNVDVQALTSWLMWRKWFYDLDNRSAQETGYLFEPILASALGGTPVSARASPIKRVSDATKGRQVDCIVDQDAYEFKLRVTIAASGQGRFGEEIDFAKDCRSSGYRPILLVLDPTPSQRLSDLSRAFEEVKGKVYVGDDAWTHIESQAGPSMAVFIEKYVRQPISQLTQHEDSLLDLTARRLADGNIEISLGNKHRTIVRNEDLSLTEDPESE